MFEQSYQSLYLEKQMILQGQTYPCPRCKYGSLEPFGETETFVCSACSRDFVAISAGRILYPACHMKRKIAPVFWWDGLHWHFAGTTASLKQLATVVLLIASSFAFVNCALLYLKYEQILGQTTRLAPWLNLLLINILMATLLGHLFYTLCWDKKLSKRRQARVNTRYKF